MLPVKDRRVGEIGASQNETSLRPSGLLDVFEVVCQLCQSLTSQPG